MASIILDTDVISFFVKDDSRAALYLPYLRRQEWLISFQTLAELYQWAGTYHWGRKRWARLTELD